jgi:hypothetical protein
MNLETILIIGFLIMITLLKYWFDKKSNLRNRLEISLLIFLLSSFWIGFLANDLLNSFSIPRLILILIFAYGLIENYWRRIKVHKQKF